MGRGGLKIPCQKFGELKKFLVKKNNMLNQTTEDVRKEFLFEFTKFLIEFSNPYAVSQLKTILEKQGKKQMIIQIPKIEGKKIEIFPKKIEEIKPELEIPKPIKIPQIQIPAMLRIPKPILPPHLQYLKPIPTNIKIDLGPLNPLIEDPYVTAIECNGANQYVMVFVEGMRKPTATTLSEEEIARVLEMFSENSMIPIQEGFVKMVVGNLVLSAVISNVVGTKFIIKKIVSYETPFSPQGRRIF